MLKRKLFFWLERLKVSRGERRAVSVLIILLLILIFINILLKPKPPFERSSYAKIEAAFKQRTALLKRRNKKIMAPYKGVAASAVILDTLPGDAGLKRQNLININTADIKTLSKLPGIGPSYAQNIIDYRNKNGPFTTKEELLQVEGIGDARLAEIKVLIVLGKTDSTFSKPLPKVESQLDESKQKMVTKRVNVNTADAKILATLPGIGPVYAQNIINYRRENGSFSSFEELLKVKGIGKKRLENLKPFIKLTGTTE